MAMTVRFLVGLIVKQLTGSRGRVDPCPSHCIFRRRGGMQNLMHQRQSTAVGRWTVVGRWTGVGRWAGLELGLSLQLVV